MTHKIFETTGAILAFSAAALSAATIPADYRLTAVTVYADRAVVTREAEVTLPQGESEVEFVNLPANINEASLQAEAYGASGLTLLETRLKTVFRKLPANERLNELQLQLATLEKQGKELDDRARLLVENQAFLNNIQKYYFNTPSPKSGTEAVTPERLSPEEWSKIWAFYEQGYAASQKESRALTEQQRELQKEMQVVRDQINKLTANSERNTRSLFVRLSGPSGKARLNIAYEVYGASWYPAYDARLGTDRMLALNYFGVVNQSTGEDWTDVALTLSTARPSLGATVPELYPWRVEVQEPVLYQTKAVRSVAAPAAMAMEAYAAGVMDNELRSEVATATVESEATSASFVVPGKITVASDNEPRKVAITTTSLPAVLNYQSVPKHNAVAFLSAKMKNTTDFPFLAGEVSTFLGGRFVATAPMKTVMPSEEFELPLGADEGISVKHQLVNRFNEDTGLTNKNRRITYEYLITIQNNKTTAEKITFRDQYPISSNEKIVVKLLSPDEKSATREADGKLVWTWDLKPGEKREARLKFSVEYPKDISVVGI